MYSVIAFYMPRGVGGGEKVFLLVNVSSVNYNYL